MANTTFQGPNDTVVITRSPSVESSFHYDRLNHISKRLAGGNQYTLDIGPTLLIGSLIFNRVKGDEARALMNFIVNDLHFTLYQFTITPPTSLDLGLDYGQAVTCRLNNVQSTDTLFMKYNVLDYWDVSIPYELVIADNLVGVGIDGIA